MVCSRFSHGLSAGANPSEPGRLDPPAEVDRYNPWKSSGWNWNPQSIHVSNDAPKLVPSQTSKGCHLESWLVVSREWPIADCLQSSTSAAKCIPFL